MTRAFYQFCAKAITREGYFLHKYRPDGSQGSSWHPWVLDGNRQFPIQEDETALVVWALWQHFETYRDVEFIKPLFRPLITSAADFIVRYRDQGTGLPLPSYDLWEERRGILSFTCAAVYGGLILEPLQWVVTHASPSGLLAEQIHPNTGVPLSVCPLTWSHAAFVMAVLLYLDKLRALKVCPMCGNPTFPRRTSEHLLHLH
ncbi:MAG: glycoside hydrolase family 15 protein [Candidatus Entotheonellia bacterium]